MAGVIGDSASSPNALPAVMWLIEHDLVEDNIAAGARALERLHGPAADEAIGTLLKEQHPSQTVLLAVLNEAASRHLVADRLDVVALEQSYRPEVRKAAQAAARALGDSRLQDYDVHVPLPPRMREFLENNAARMLTPLPEPPVWKAIQGSDSSAQGWLLQETNFQWCLLDDFARENWYFRYGRHLQPGSLAAVADDLIARRAGITALQAAAQGSDPDGEKVRQKRAELSCDGVLSAQFEPNFLSMPEMTVAVWCWQQGDLERCRRLLDPCFSSADDDRWLDWAARDYLGHAYHIEMVEAFCDDENDAAALRLAQHLSKPVFDGFEYQERAKELATQLTRKDQDGEVGLPVLPVWWILQVCLTRDQQIAYLAKRLKLLHTEQDMQPGDVYYDSAMPYSLTGIICINPYLELKRMQLVNRDFVALAPFAADRDYMRTYSYFRDFHPSRNLHRVCWAVQKLVNEAAIPPAPPQSLDQVMAQTMKELNGTAAPKNEILSRAADGSVYFTAHPQGDVIKELHNWAQAQPPRGFWATWWQTPTALLISYLVYRRYLYVRAHPRPPRRPLFSRRR